MSRKILNIVSLILLLLMSVAIARPNPNQRIYNKALSFERRGEYAKAESLYVGLYEESPDNYTYYNRYRQILLTQRKYDKLLPVLQQRAEKRQFDRYIKLETGVLYFALDQKSRSKKIWADVFMGQKGNMRDSYASSVYRYAVEYGLGADFDQITQILRSMTGDPRLLVRYNFSNCLRYRDWERAIAEIMHILETDVRDLSYVRQNLFRYDPLSALYRRSISALEDSRSVQGLVLLSDIYIHTKEYDQAFRVLSQNMTDESVRRAMKEFAEHMFDQEKYELADQAAELIENNEDTDDATRLAMSLLSARAKEDHFYELIKEPSIIPKPYYSEFLTIEFKPFDPEESKLIKDAYMKFDSLRSDRGPYGELAALHHADITYLVYQDFDTAMKEYLSLASAKTMMAKVKLISRLSRLMIAKGQYSEAQDLLGTAAMEYGLMVDEEDRLLAQGFYVSVMAGERDSLIERTNRVLAMLPQDDDQYNDFLAYSAIVNRVMKDSLNYNSWIKAERYLLMNNTASAIDIYKELMAVKSDAYHIYALRYLNCLTARKDRSAEELFWKKHYNDLIDSEMGDYFMLRYAGFMEKMQKFDISYEIFEKYLLSYRESMYYENIREYVREHYSLGAP